MLDLPKKLARIDGQFAEFQYAHSIFGLTNYSKIIAVNIWYFLYSSFLDFLIHHTPAHKPNPEGEQKEGSGGYQYQGSKVTPGLHDPSDWRSRPTFHQDFSNQGGYYSNANSAAYPGLQGEFYPYQNYRSRNFDNIGSWSSFSKTVPTSKQAAYKKTQLASIDNTF